MARKVIKPTKLLSLSQANSIAIEKVINFKKIKRTDYGITVNCPLHKDKDFSMYIDKKNKWFCSICNKGGTVIDLVVDLYGTPLIDAVKRIEKHAN